MNYTLAEWVSLAAEGGLAQAAVRAQAEESGQSEAQVRKHMAGHLAVMREAVADGLREGLRSVSGLSGGQAVLLMGRVAGGQALCGGLLGKAEAYALATAECNACMGKIVAAPTAGACGILPGAVLAMMEERGKTEAQAVDALFVAAAVAEAIATQASISGAEGGCQAECGSAAAMAGAAVVYLLGGTNEQSADACCFALMNSMGLVCDPVGGLVEIPCVYRNVSGVMNALSAAEMALAGMHSLIPADQVIDAMKAVGDAMPASLRETGEGGVAACPGCARFK